MAAPADQQDANLPPLPMPHPVADYEKIQRVGEGTYGVVYKARHRNTGEIVALKKLRMDRERDGMPVTSVREVRVLQACHHVNLVQLKRVVTGSKLDSVFLVFEYCEHDLARLMDVSAVRFDVGEAKCLLQQLLRAVAFLHSRWIVHRDLKLSNLLLTDRGVLKLCDMGLARWFKAEDAAYTPRVVTLWYRAPELLLGADHYTEAVDMWAVGCIMAELLHGSPLFPGKTEVETLNMLFQLLGTPSDRIWPGFQRLPLAGKVALPDQPYSYLRKEFKQLSAAGVDLLNKLLTYDPDKRITAKAALRHPWFSEPPYPRDCSQMPHFSCIDTDSPTGASHVRDVRQEAVHNLGFKRQYASQQASDRIGEVFDTRAAKHRKR